jgi:hypothetical protein
LVYAVATPVISEFYFGVRFTVPECVHPSKTEVSLVDTRHIASDRLRGNAVGSKTR